MKRETAKTEASVPEGPIPEDWEPETDHDDSLIRWMLDLSPAKRLAAAQGFVDSVRIWRTARRVESG